MTSSTVSRLSAPRSSTKDASGVTSSSSTPSWSTMIFFTRSATGSMKLLRGPVAGRPLILLLHVEAAVHPEHLSRDVGGGIGYEKGDGAGDVLRAPDAAQGDGSGQGLLRLVRHGGGHVGVDEARGNGVDGDRPRCDLAGDGLGEPDDARLAGG